MTPIEIKILLHYYTMPGDYTGVGEGSVSHEQALDRFLQLGLLERSNEPGQQYTATEGVKVYVEALMAVPLPERKWVIPGSDRQKGTSA
jgi:hypothetical protein